MASLCCTVVIVTVLYCYQCESTLHTGRRLFHLSPIQEAPQRHPLTQGRLGLPERTVGPALTPNNITQQANENKSIKYGFIRLLLNHNDQITIAKLLSELKLCSGQTLYLIVRYIAQCTICLSMMQVYLVSRVVGLLGEDCKQCIYGLQIWAVQAKRRHVKSNTNR